MFPVEIDPKSVVVMYSNITFVNETSHHVHDYMAPLKLGSVKNVPVYSLTFEI
jgi:hypothetical protein